MIEVIDVLLELVCDICVWCVDDFVVYLFRLLKMRKIIFGFVNICWNIMFLSFDEVVEYLSNFCKVIFFVLIEFNFLKLKWKMNWRFCSLFLIENKLWLNWWIIWDINFVLLILGFLVIKIFFGFWVFFLDLNKFWKLVSWIFLVLLYVLKSLSLCFCFIFVLYFIFFCKRNMLFVI